jgi:hypothetical protein
MNKDKTKMKREKRRNKLGKQNMRKEGKHNGRKKIKKER